MSDRVDLLLDTPDEAELLAALNRAGSRAGVDRTTADHWRSVLDDVAGRAEGHMLPIPGQSLRVAWWTNHRGVKHVRIVGGDADVGFDDRPPLWHVFPDHVYRVVRPGEAACWLVSCTCGETGSATELGWMGQRCAACHDRLQEGQPHPEDGRPMLFAGPGIGMALAFSPDGQSLVVSSGGWFTRILELASGAERVLCDLETEESQQEEAHGPFAFSPDGRWVTGGYPGEYGFHCWEIGSQDDPRHGGYSVMSQGHDGFGMELRAISFSPDGRFVASCGDTGEFEVRGGADTGEFSTIIDDGETEGCTAFTFSPDGGTLALALLSGLIVFRDTRSWQRLAGHSPQMRSWEETIFLRYTPDGQRLVIVTTVARLRKSISRLHLWDLAAGKRTRSTSLLAAVRVAALSPDGRYLACIIHDEGSSPGEIHFQDVESWTGAGWLAWNPEVPLNDLAFSPGGRTLATISQDGVIKLWPWQLLLRRSEIPLLEG